ncbi:hypothetical protein BDN67DRAFT_1013926 [Paxillus ammoniavirescens]|nr:hypothetical protein BDN67DRAFT_1013926 [Paxillus ammoniavirescens]
MAAAWPASYKNKKTMANHLAMSMSPQYIAWCSALSMLLSANFGGKLAISTHYSTPGGSCLIRSLVSLSILPLTLTPHHLTMKKTSDSGGQSSGGLNTTITVEALLALISTLSLSPEAASQLSDAIQNQVVHQAHHEEGDPGDNHHTNIAQPSSEDLPSSGVGRSSASFPPITSNSVSSSSLSLDPFPGVLSNLPEGVSIGTPQSSAPPSAVGDSHPAIGPVGTPQTFAPPSAVGDPRPAVSGQPHPMPNGHYLITYNGVSFILPFQEEDSPFYLIT